MVGFDRRGAALVCRACALCAVTLSACVAAPALAAAGRPAGCEAAGRALSGDVDHDGVRDRVSLTTATARGARCRYAVVVRSSRRRYTVRVRPYSGKDDGVPPSLVALVRIARDRSLQIVVDVHHGASTAFADVYGIHRGVLRRLPFGGRGFGGFSYLGSLASTTGIDCAGGAARGAVVTTAEVPAAGGRWAVTRETLRLRNGHFERVLWQSRTRPDRVDLPYRPFASCTAAAAVRREGAPAGR